MPTPMSASDEIKIVAMIARGDTYKTIQKQMNTNEATISAIKKRNKQNLIDIKQAMVQQATIDALSIKEKANAQLNDRLNIDEKNAQILSKAQDAFINGDIDLKEFTEISRQVKEMSVTELVSISKEMHNQSKAEDDEPKEQKDLTALIEAIKSGDEVKLQQMVFNSKSE